MGLGTGGLWNLLGLSLGPRNVEETVGHRIVEWQLAYYFTDLFIDVLVDPLCLLGSHPLLDLIEETQAQILRGGSHNALNPVAAGIAHDRGLFFQVEQAGLTGETVGGMQALVIDDELHRLKRLVLRFGRKPR